MALKAENIFYTYPQSQRPVLTGFSAQFPFGEITALSGKNGCGKTTFSRILTGIMKPDRGDVSLDGESIASHSLAEIGRRVGYVMQNPVQQLFCTSVEEEIRYGLENMELDPEEIRERIGYYLNYFQLEQYRNVIPFRLSQGEKQRVVLAAILAMRPRYLILDEPTAALDRYRSRLLGEYLRKIAKDSCGIILISHDLAFIRQYTDREIVMGEV